MNKLKTLTMLLAVTIGGSFAVAQSADLLAGKSVHLLGEARTWSAGETSVTFDDASLTKLTAVPTNTDDVFLYPENRTLNTEENQAKGAQPFYVDMGESQTVGTVTTTWEGAAADSYNIYLTDEEPTIAILNTEPVYTATGLGKYTANTAVLPDGSEGRYLVFEVTKATDWTWGVKMRSISATAPVAPEFTVFNVSPTLIVNNDTPLTITYKDQLGREISAGMVTLTVSDNATLTDGKLTVNTGESATLTATVGGTSLNAVVYVPSAPALPDEADILTPIFTNTVTEKNATAGFTVAYNGGAKDSGNVTYPDGEVAREFLDTRCVFFHNSETTGDWNGNINPEGKGYGELRLSIFAGRNANGYVEFEGTDGVIGHTQNFTLEAGKWNDIKVNVEGETRLNNMSVRFDEADMCDIMLANVYFTPADAEAPVLSDIEAVSTQDSVKLRFSARDKVAGFIDYTITATKADAAEPFASYTSSEESGVQTIYTVSGLDADSEYTFAVTASDGRNVSEPGTVTIKTRPSETKLPDSTDPDTDADKTITLYSSYGNTWVPVFEAADGSATTLSVVNTENGNAVLSVSNLTADGGSIVLAPKSFGFQNAEYMKIDLYSADGGDIAITLEWEKAVVKKTEVQTKADEEVITPVASRTVTVNAEAGKWTTADIDIKDAGTGFGITEPSVFVNRIKFAKPDGSTVSNFQFDNLYFGTDSDSGDWTSVENVTVQEESAVVNVYDMRGVAVRYGVDRDNALEGLPAGLYIVNGMRIYKPSL